MPGVAVVTDSTSDLDPAACARYGIAVVPLYVNFGTQSYRDGVDLSRDAFYAKLVAEEELPTTTQPSPAMFEAVFRPFIDDGATVICLTIMAGLSGTMNAAAAAARAFPAGTVRVVDSETVSGGLALQAMRAAELARTGLGADAILDVLRADRARQRGYATIPDLSYAVRTGRISRAQAFVGSLVKIVPVLRIDGGRIGQEARVRTFVRAQEAMIAAATQAIGDPLGARVCIMHTRAPELAASVERRLRAGIATALRAIQIVEAGPVIATHAGPGGVGIFVAPG
jgi:DegV family protein with EDD domain